ncbi:hypothetical protein BGZ99_004591 [Dissophora globulifera]|uniref:N-acetyltransferase domain-containing protein n=1 Tax=Dissophora globulifera TaxID=979702 RepID=A0A9P6UUX9_9FUNG|nr:hypothetical protein BGZ99_004591 [Dissophora globulifera]
MTAKPFIKYTTLPESEYTHRTLGVNNGTQIETEQIRLVPFLMERDTPLMWEVSKPELFTWMPSGELHTYEAFHKTWAGFSTLSDWYSWVIYVSAPAEGGEKKWVLCGHVCLLDISLIHRRSEVGCIWLHPSVQGTFVMLETNYALLRFAFEKLQAGRVQWKTHFRNIASQKAAVKLGFTLEGLFRKHMAHTDGKWRHSYFYSMTDDEWFGREEETEDARRGLDVIAAAAELLNGPEVASQGRQKQLEELIAEKKKTGKQLPSSIEGKPLVGEMAKEE